MSRVDEYAAPFMGVDTSRKANDNASWGLRAPWFNELYNHSNFSFLGVYLTHEAIPKNAKDLYSSTSRFNGNNWTKSWETLRKQGWGCWFIYAGYTPGDNPNNSPPAGKNWTVEAAKADGIRHGTHIKVAISEFLTKYSSDNAGSTVFLDNEGAPLNDQFKAYYNSVFEELRKPGPGDCQPVRPGFYARDQNAFKKSPAVPNASEMLDANPDIFIWLLDHHWEAASGKRINKDRMRPIPQEIGDRLYLDPINFDIRARRRNDITSGHTVTNIPVGIQGFLNYCKDPWAKKKRAKDPDAPLDNWPNMPTRALTKELTPVNPWDFDMSFVRDPRYPEASPRVRSLNGTVARGSYVKPEMRMEVVMSHIGVSPGLTGSIVEPDAPLLLPDENTVISLDTSGNIVTSSLAGNPPAWSPLTTVVSAALASPLRRSRALAAIKLPDNSMHVFYIGRDLSFQTLQRSAPNATWQGPNSVFSKPIRAIHAFCNIACTIDISRPHTVALITISETSHLQLTAYGPPPSANATPFVWNNTVENQMTPPTLLLGTALLAITPHPTANLVFAVSRSLRLTLFSNQISQGWSGPIVLGDATTDKVFAHTRLACNIVSPTLVQVAAISYEGDPVIYILTFDSQSKTWGLAVPPTAISKARNPETFPRRRTKPPNLGPLMPLGKGELDARQWSTNPYGDLNFGLDPSGTGQMVLMCPASGPDNAVGVLYRRFGVLNEDWYLRE